MTAIEQTASINTALNTVSFNRTLNKINTPFEENSNEVQALK